VSLIRFSFAEDAVQSIATKIRHFYDLYFLINDSECKEFINSSDFKQRFISILNHDKKIFDEPKNWQAKKLEQSPLISNFNDIWEQLKESYNNELSALAFKEIPEDREIVSRLSEILKLIK